MEIAPQSSDSASAGKSGNRARLGILVIVLIGVGAYAGLKFKKHFDEGDINHGNIEKVVGQIQTETDHLPEPQQEAKFLDCLNSDNPATRYAGVDGLGRIRASDDKVKTPLENAFKDSYAGVRERVLQVLPLKDPVAGTKLTLAGLQDDDSWIRVQSATELHLFVKKGTPQANSSIPYLMKALDDPDPMVTNMALTALAKFTGHPWKVNRTAPAKEQHAMVAKWKAWWSGAQAKWPVDAAYQNVTPIQPTRTDSAPGLSVKAASGDTVSPQNGHVTFVRFWTYTPYSKADAQELQRMYAELKDKGVDVIGLGMSAKNVAEIQQNIKEFGTTYPQAVATEDAMRDFGHINDPTTFIIDKQGQIRYRLDGDRDYETYKTIADKLIAEK